MLGMSVGTSVGGSSGVRLSINIIQSYTDEVSDWGFSDVVVWNRVLPYAEMKKVSDAMLKSICGGSHYWNSVTSACTACQSGWQSTGTNCICNQTAGFYVNSVTNLCTACPVGSNSTGSSCVFIKAISDRPSSSSILSSTTPSPSSLPGPSSPPSPPGPPMNDTASCAVESIQADLKIMLENNQQIFQNQEKIKRKLKRLKKLAKK
jgi:hypothetical protein